MSGNLDAGCAVRTDSTLACWGSTAQPPAGRVRKVVVADAPEVDLRACALKDDGSIACWQDGYSPFAEPPAGTFVDVDLGYEHGCGIRTDGTIACWGDLDDDFRFGQLDAPGGTYTAVAAGDAHTCALDPGGHAVCWGNNDFGQSSPPGGVFTSIVSGSLHTCGTRATGELVCWGDDAAGAAALDPAAMRVAAVTDAVPIHAASLSVAEGSVCIIRPDRTLACWGSDVAPPAGRYLQVVTGGDSQRSCGLTEAGRITCWGVEAEAEYAAEDPESAEYLGSGPPNGRFTAISFDGYAGCGIRADRRIRCWGVGPPKAPKGTYTDVTVSSDDSVVCGLRTDGRIVCAGGYEEDGTSPPKGTFEKLAGQCGITIDGEVRCPDSQMVGMGSERFIDVSGGCALHVGGQITCTASEDDEGPLPSVPSGAYAAFEQSGTGGCGILRTGVLVCWDQAARILANTRPRAMIAIPDRVRVSGTVAATWSGNAPGSSVMGYDVRVRPTGKRATWTTWAQNTTATSGAIRLPDASPGGGYEIQARARAGDGTVSDWATAWLSQPGDDKDFKASGAWTRVKSPTLYRGSALKATKHEARLTMPIAGINFDLVATTCPTCGTIRVSITRTSEEEEDGGVGAPDPVVINLGSRTTTTRRLLNVFFDDSDPTVWGTVLIEVLSSGQPVVIDGYVLN